MYFLNEVKVSPSEAVSVGNSDLDILTARNTGCLDIIVDRGNDDFSIAPSILIKSLNELI